MKIVSFCICLLLITACNLVNSRQSDNSYALWADKNTGASWTVFTEKIIEKSLLHQSNPEDIEYFCPKYKSITKTDKIKFWTGLISSMAYYESSFDPNAEYTEKFKDNQGEYIVSRGLLQLSFESANQKAYNCNIESDQDLYLAEVNLNCGINILSYWLNKDKAITSIKSKIKGAGRYWAVLRSNNGQLEKIQAYTQALDFCKF
jgi:hypothetical protein